MSSGGHEYDHICAAANAMADPVRIAVLDRLMSGPASVSELAERLALSQPRLSYHLSILRDCNFVRSRRVGRAVLYEIRDAETAHLVEAVFTVSRRKPRGDEKTSELLKARTCYDHLAGQLGVSIFDSMMRMDVLRLESRPSRTSARVPVCLGPKGAVFFESLNIEVQGVKRRRRQFAFGCMDWTEKRFHLGGALGAAIWTLFFENQWAFYQPATRAVSLTTLGKTKVSEHFDVPLSK